MTFSINFLPLNEEPGVFRAQPSSLKHPNYKCLIDNTIQATIIDYPTNKSPVFYN